VLAKLEEYAQKTWGQDKPVGFEELVDELFDTAELYIIVDAGDLIIQMPMCGCSLKGVFRPVDLNEYVCTNCGKTIFIYRKEV